MVEKTISLEKVKWRNEMKIKSQDNQLKLIFDSKPIAYSSNELFIKVPQNCAKCIGKFPKKVVHASFLQCSTYIVIDQDDD